MIRKAVQSSWDLIRAHVAKTPKAKSKPSKAPKPVKMGGNGKTVLSQLSYREYLQTGHWIQTRNRILKERGYRCESCGTPHRIEVHHLTYARLGNECRDDLLVLCRECHGLRHLKSNNR